MTRGWTNEWKNKQRYYSYSKRVLPSSRKDMHAKNITKSMYQFGLSAGSKSFQSMSNRKEILIQIIYSLKNLWNGLGMKVRISQGFPSLSAHHQNPEDTKLRLLSQLSPIHMILVTKGWGSEWVAPRLPVCALVSTTLFSVSKNRQMFFT